MNTITHVAAHAQLTVQHQSDHWTALGTESLSSAPGLMMIILLVMALLALRLLARAMRPVLEVVRATSALIGALILTMAIGALAIVAIVTAYR